MQQFDTFYSLVNNKDASSHTHTHTHTHEEPFKLLFPFLKCFIFLYCVTLNSFLSCHNRNYTTFRLISSIHIAMAKIQLQSLPVAIEDYSEINVLQMKGKSI